MHFALLPPADAVIFVMPALIAVTTPSSSTVATAVLLEVHVTVLSVALSGLTVAVSVNVFPISRSAAVLSSVTPVTSTDSDLIVRVPVSYVTL